MESDSERPLEIFHSKNANPCGSHQPFGGSPQQMFNLNQRFPYQDQQNYSNHCGRGNHRFRGSSNGHRGSPGIRGHVPPNFRGNRFPRNHNPRYNTQQQIPNGYMHMNSQSSRTEHSPWMTPEILSMIQEKDKVQQDTFTSPNPDAFRVLKALRGRLNIAINDAKYLYNEKVKEAKTMKAQGKPSVLYCDPCDRAFPDENLLQEHKDEHIICKLDGCTFTAHHKIILKHIQMQHSNDMFFRVKGYDSPEEVQKWITDRKKKFPTQNNIEIKKAEIAERKQRGETFGIRSERRPPRPNRFSLDSRGRTNRNFNSNSKFDCKAKSESDSCKNVESKQKFETKSSESRDKSSFTKRRRRNFKNNTWNSENIDGLSSQNVSPIITLDTYYSNVELNEQGGLVGKSKIKWTSGMYNDADETTSESEEETENMHITDDEEENIQSNVNLNRPLLLRGIDITCNSKPVPASITVVSDDANVVSVPTGPLGLVSYSSDSDVGDSFPSKAIPKVDYQNGVSAQSEEVCPMESNSSNSIFPKIITDTENEPFGKEIEDKFRIDNIRKPENDCRSDDSAPEEIFTKVELEENGSVISSELSCNSGRCGNEKPIEKVTQKSNSSVSKPRFKQPIMPSRRRIAFLERLLKEEINQERNYIMQACQYIQENSFFDDQPSETTDSIK